VRISGAGTPSTPAACQPGKVSGLLPTAPAAGSWAAGSRRPLPQSRPHPSRRLSRPQFLPSPARGRAGARDGRVAAVRQWMVRADRRGRALSRGRARRGQRPGDRIPRHGRPLTGRPARGQSHGGVRTGRVLLLRSRRLRSDERETRSCSWTRNRVTIRCRTCDSCRKRDSVPPSVPPS
jgi:hypothetical protein